jgi:serine/threonine protein phosphatase PrpC
LVDGRIVVNASISDPSCILLDIKEGVVFVLTVDHRLEDNVEQRGSVTGFTASGSEVGRMDVYGIRCRWPDGLCISRSIRDKDVKQYIVPIPHVKQVKLTNAGGDVRLIIAFDCIWDALSNNMDALSCRGLHAELAAKLVIMGALRSSSKDETACLVVDIIHSDLPIVPISTSKKKHKVPFTFLKHFFFK